ncbi:MAG TPA: hypothetical protein VIX12_06430 [Candidatus Binataceae bacterium]
MSIYEQVVSFIHSPELAGFGALAMSVFHYQFQNVQAYRQFCVEQGCGPASVRSINEIPAVSTFAFKYANLVDAAATNSAQALVFLTSGTTAGRNRRGRHVVIHPEIYRASAIGHLRAMLFPDGRRLRILAIHPTAEVMPESSLSRMISWCIEEFGNSTTLCAADRRGVDLTHATEFLRDSKSAADPVCILGTTAALSAIFEHLDRKHETISLPPGSRVMDTGGPKGQEVPLDPAEVVANSHRLLSIDPDWVINEYGMTELCSQLYDATRFNSAGIGPRRSKIAPPWLRVAAVDPVTLKPVRDGALGILRFFDLANVGSVSAILTEDVGAVRGNRIEIIGRAALGEPRGCALAIEQFAANALSQEQERHV